VYAEEGAFWVGGSRFANVVLQADQGVRAALLEILNAPVPNRVTIVGGGQRFARALSPGETVLVPIAFDDTGTARLQLSSEAGFIPAAVDPGNRDHRVLGIYVQVRSALSPPRRDP
jgi:hypothetical protein